MMMAHDSNPGRSDLAAETIDAVRSALAEYVVNPADGEPLRRALDTTNEKRKTKTTDG